MVATFLIVSTADRLEDLIRLLDSIRADDRFSAWPIVVALQGYAKADKEFFYGSGVSQWVDELVFIDQRIGPHRARRLLLHRVPNGPYCCLDDDMVLLPETNYAPILKRLQEDPLTGLVSAGWVKTEAWLPRFRTSLRDEWIKQPVVYTGGGLLFNDDTADIIRKMPDKPFWTDNLQWSLAVYLSGRFNFRYRGSLAIHEVCRKGGRKAWLQAGPAKIENKEVVFPDRKYVDWAINYLPATKNLTPLAHETHANNRAQLLRY